MASIAIAMLIATIGVGEIVISMEFATPAQIAGIVLGAIAILSFVALGSLIMWIAIRGERRTLCFDLQNREVIYTTHSLRRPYSEQRYPFSDIANIDVTIHETEGALPNYSVSLLTKRDASMEWGLWYERENAEAFAASVRKQLQ